MSLGKLMKSIKKPTELLMTPKIEGFLREHGGPVLDAGGIELLQGIADRAQGNNGLEARSNRFGASSRGTCHRRQVFAFIGMPGLRIMDPELSNLFNDGNWRHMRWQVMGLQSGALTHAEWPAAMAKYRVKVSMDGLNAEEAWIFELKGDRNYARILADGVPEPHLLQIHTMLLVTGWDVASYVMEDKSTQQWREIVVKKDPVIITKVRNELEELNEYVEERRLPDPLPACTNREGPYKTCPFASECIDRWEASNYWPDVPGDWDS